MDTRQASRDVMSAYVSANGTPRGSTPLDPPSADSATGRPGTHQQGNSSAIQTITAPSGHSQATTAPPSPQKASSTVPSVSSPLATRAPIRSQQSTVSSAPSGGSTPAPSQQLAAHARSLFTGDVKHASLVGLHMSEGATRPARPTRLGPNTNTGASHSTHQLFHSSAAAQAVASPRLTANASPKLSPGSTPAAASPAHSGMNASGTNNSHSPAVTQGTSSGTTAGAATTPLQQIQLASIAAPNSPSSGSTGQILIQALRFIRKVWRGTKIGQGVIDFWTLNLIFITMLAIIGSFVIFAIEAGRADLTIHYTDCLFLAASAVTVTGMTPFEFAQFRQGSIVTCYCLMTLGSTIVLSIPPVLIRRYLYRARFGNPATQPKRSRLESNRSTFRDTIQRSGMALASVASQVMPKVDVPKLLGSITSLNEHGEATEGNSIQSTAEYEAAGLLLKVYVGYIVGAQLLGILILGIYGTLDKTTNALLIQYGSTPLTWAVFHTASAFYNVGLGLLPGSLTLFKFDNFVLVVTCTLLAAGNCLFPVVLRAVVVVLVKVGDRGGLNRRTTKSVRFLLKNPRRASIHLFKRRDTWSLFLTWAVTIATQLLSSMIFDFPVASFRELTPVKRFGVFLLQSVSNRTGGFFIYQMESFTPVTLLVFLGFMYADSYPLLTIIRKSGASGQVEEVVRSAIERNKSQLRPGGQLGAAPDSIIASQTLLAAKSLLMRGFNSEVQLEGYTHSPELRARVSSSRSAHDPGCSGGGGGITPWADSVASSLARPHNNTISVAPTLPPVSQSPAGSSPTSPMRSPVMERHPLVQRIRAESALASSASSGTTGRGLATQVPATAVGSSHLGLAPTPNHGNAAASKAALGSMFLVPLGLVQSHGPSGHLESMASLRLSRIVGGTFEDVAHRSAGSLPPTSEAIVGPNGELMHRSPTHITAIAPIVPIVPEHRGVVNWIVQDLFWVFSAMLVIAMAEAANPYLTTRGEFDMFGLLFNCISAYGTVGLSLGTTFGTRAASNLQDLSQVVLVLLMLVGRCRGIPATIDYSFASEDGITDPESPPPAKDIESAHGARTGIVQSAPDGGMPRTSSVRRASIGSIVTGKLAAASTSIQAAMSRSAAYQEMESPAIRITGSGSGSTSGIIPRVTGTSTGVLPEPNPSQHKPSSLNVQPTSLTPGVRIASTDDAAHNLRATPSVPTRPTLVLAATGLAAMTPQIRPRSVSHSIKSNSVQGGHASDGQDARVAISTMITERHVGSAFTSTTIVATPEVASAVMGLRLTAAKGDPQIGTGTTAEGARQVIVSGSQAERNTVQTRVGVSPDIIPIPTVLLEKASVRSDESVQGHRRSISLPASTIDLRIVLPLQAGSVQQQEPVGGAAS